MSIDLARVRAETPGCEGVVHFNNAGASLQPRPVLDAQLAMLESEAVHGGYEADEIESERLDRFRTAGARLLGADPREIAYTSSASEAWWRAFTSVPLRAGQKVLLDRATYNANAFAMIQAQQGGVELVLIGDDQHGQLDLDELDAHLGPDVALVCVTHVPTSGGLVNPAEEVGALLAGREAWYLLDACQSAGQLDIDVARIGCHLLSLTGRKFVRGPRGSGLLWVDQRRLDELDDPTFIDARSAEWIAPFEYRLAPDAQRFEFFEHSRSARAGFGVALEYAVHLGIADIESRVVELAAELRHELDRVPGVAVADLGRRRCGIVTFEIDGLDAPQVSDRLRQRSINTSVTTAASARLDLGARGIEHLVRASVHYFNQRSEIDQLTDAVSDLAAHARR